MHEIQNSGVVESHNVIKIEVRLFDIFFFSKIFQGKNTGSKVGDECHIGEGGLVDPACPFILVQIL